MSAPELHPDDLLDKEAHGSLTTGERERLDQHRSRCALCRFEGAVRLDFRDELDDDDFGRSLRPGEDGSASTPPRSGIYGSPPHVRSRLSWLVLTAAVLLLASTAAAAWGYRERLFTRREQSRNAHAPGVAAERSTRDDAHQQPERAAPIPMTIASAVLSIPSPEPPQPVAHPTASAQRARPLEATRANVLSEPAPPELPSADTLFERAREARERGAYDEAIHAYQELTGGYPQTEEATTAHAILGRLLLDRGLPAEALTHFDTYLLSGSGSGQLLGEEARVGRALALGRLARANDEAEAWSQLLAEFPDSIHAERARKRLAELAPR